MLGVQSNENIGLDYLHLSLNGQSRCMGWICTHLGAYLLHLFPTFVNILTTSVSMKSER